MGPAVAPGSTVLVRTATLRRVGSRRKPAPMRKGGYHVRRVERAVWEARGRHDDEDEVGLIGRRFDVGRCAQPDRGFTHQLGQAGLLHRSFASIDEFDDVSVQIGANHIVPLGCRSAAKGHPSLPSPTRASRISCLSDGRSAALGG